MPIRPSQPPPESQAELTRSMREISARSPHIDMAARAADAAGGAPVLRFAHQAFTLTPDAIRAGAGADAAEARSWRYVVPSPQGDAIAEVADEGERGHRFTQLTAGLHSAASRESIEWVNTEADLGNDTYEVRALRIAALLIDSVWLKNLSGGSDWFAVVRSLTPMLQSKHLYAPEEFFAVLRDLLDRQAGFNNSPAADRGGR